MKTGKGEEAVPWLRPRRSTDALSVPAVHFQRCSFGDKRSDGPTGRSRKKHYFPALHSFTQHSTCTHIYPYTPDSRLCNPHTYICCKIAKYFKNRRSRAKARLHITRHLSRIGLDIFSSLSLFVSQLCLESLQATSVFGTKSPRFLRPAIIQKTVFLLHRVVFLL